MSAWIAQNLDCSEFGSCRIQIRDLSRRLDKRIYKTEIKFWAILGCQGCREKTLPTAISMQLFGVVFYCFEGQFLFYFFLEYPSIRTEKLHSIKAKKIFQNLESFILG